jgi:glucans biosynthesis protein
MKVSRRSVTVGIAAHIAALSVAPPFPALAAARRGKPQPFSRDWLRARARELAGRPYSSPPATHADLLNRIDYDAYQQIHYRPQEALWADKAPFYPVELFHMGRYFQRPARIFMVNGDTAEEILYSPDLFSFGRSGFARELPDDIGFAGFRVMLAKGQPDWLAFLGASYFRSCGETKQYGQSARGLAIDTGLPTGEEFPAFTHFWLEQRRGSPGVVIHALLDGPSVTGAYAITATRETAVITEVEAQLFARKDITRLGVAPLTSMYWFGKINRQPGVDWRPEIHDTDGLAIWTGSGERIWRPLNNPPRIQTSTFFDRTPKGFGLLQRERRFDKYEDDGVFYNLRPSVWIEPLGDWGEGAIQLVELPTDDEINDNIVAYWTPKEQFRAGGSMRFHYRAHWRLEEPYPAAIGRVIATRAGMGGVPGQPRLKGVTRYAVDFSGAALGQLTVKDGVKAKVSARGGVIKNTAAYPVVGGGYWRVIFDFTPPDADPVDLRMYLTRNGEALTETWIYQHLPQKTGVQRHPT